MLYNYLVHSFSASPNILFLKYEDLKKDGKAVVAKMAEFMGCTLETATINHILNQAAFNKMKQSETLTSFARRPGETPHFRKGVVGDWKNYFSEEQSARMDAECCKRLAGTGLDFLFE